VPFITANSVYLLSQRVRFFFRFAMPNDWSQHAPKASWHQTSSMHKGQSSNEISEKIDRCDQLNKGCIAVLLQHAHIQTHYD
jgi:hypothetical protein